MKRKNKKPNPVLEEGAKSLHKDAIVKHLQYSKSLSPSKTKEWAIPHLAAAKFDDATSSYAQFAQEIWGVNGEDMKCE
jgi:hypothetical protein